MTTPRRFLLVSLSALFVLGALASMVAQEQTASQFYLSYRAVFAKAEKIDDLLPYMSKATVTKIQSTPAEERANMFDMVKALDTYTDLKVLKEAKTEAGVTLTVEGVDADKLKASGTIEIVREDGKWKIGRERWSQ